MSWFAGSLQPTFGAAFGSTDLNTLATGAGQMSTLADLANGTAGDQYAGIGFSLTFASTTLVAGASVAIYNYPLNPITAGYGDGLFSPAGGHVAIQPSIPPWAFNAPITGGAVTSLIGFIPRIVLPASSFRFVFFNLLGVTVSTGTVQFFTYNN